MKEERIENLGGFDNEKFKVDSLVVCNLRYDIVKKEGIPCKKQESAKTILDEINLDIKLGQLNAILGPSGSGKVKKIKRGILFFFS